MRYHVYQFSDKTENFDFLDPNLPKNGFWHQHFKNLSLDSESASLRYYVYQFPDKTDNFEYLGPNLPKNRFWRQNLKNLSLDSESASLRYCVYQFSDKMDNFEYLGPNLPKNGFWARNFKGPNSEEIAQLCAIFWFKYCWGCCKELGRGWNELGGGNEAGWRLKWTAWRGIELGGGGWRWVELGAWFSNTHLHHSYFLWLCFHVKIKYLKTECIEMREYIAWNCVKLLKLCWFI